MGGRGSSGRAHASHAIPVQGREGRREGGRKEGERNLRIKEKSGNTFLPPRPNLSFLLVCTYFLNDLKTLHSNV
jgi:hypothetical protein